MMICKATLWVARSGDEEWALEGGTCDLDMLLGIELGGRSLGSSLGEELGVSVQQSLKKKMVHVLHAIV